MTSKTLELSLNEVLLNKTGSLTSAKTNHAVIATLIWPRPRIAERTALNTHIFENKTLKLSNASWATRILFKETVSGPFALKIDITESLADSQVQELVQFLSASLYQLGSAAAEGIASTSLPSIPLKYLNAAISASKKKKPAIIASGTIDLDTSKTWKKGKTQRIKLPLLTPDKVTHLTRVQKSGKASTQKKTLLPKGAENGFAVVSAKLY